MHREEYETDVAERFKQWRTEIEALYAEATDRDVAESVGDEETQVQKLQGQFEMAWEQFTQLRAVNSVEAWQELQPGLDQKLQRLEAALSRTRRQIAG